MNSLKISPVLLFSLLCGCLEDINLDTGERILNVYCVLKQESEQVLELSYITPTGRESSPVGEGVTISLYDGDQSVGHFTRTSETEWNLDYKPKGGHTYRLEVIVPGEETLTAETRYPSTGTFLRGVVVVEVEKASSGYYTPTIFGYELNSSEDQILWCYFENQRDRPVLTYLASDHPGVDGRGETIYPFDRDSPVYKKKFDNGSSMHDASGNLLPDDFFGGPAFLHEKILRIVHPADFSRPVDKEKLNIYHYDFDGDNRILVEESGMSGVFCFGAVDVSGPLVLNSVSTEYDNYLCDFYYSNHDSGDFSALVYRKNHYSNVMNGAGIFGAIIEYR